MSGTNAVRCKRALIDRVKVLLGSDVQVEYAFPGRTIQREAVWAGKVTFSQDLATMRGGGRASREERLIVNLHIGVEQPGGDEEVYDAELRAADISQTIEDYLAANPTLEGLSGLLVAAVAEGELDQGVDDDFVGCELMLRVAFHCHLT